MPIQMILRDIEYNTSCWLELVNVIQLHDYSGPIYYITYPNFQAITTYNKSRMYATAVWLLGTEVASR